jgi:hypothetical protein
MGKMYMMKLSSKHLPAYKDIIIEMMRYGGAVDQIADDLNCSEQDLVFYIKSSGIDKQLSRRSWKWKAADKRKRNFAKSEFLKKGG